MAHTYQYLKANEIADKFDNVLIEGYKKLYKNYDHQIKTPGYDHFESIPEEIAYNQSNGIDRKIYLTDGKEFKHEEKIRAEVYDDIACEFISNSKTMEKGWALKDLLCDVITYAFSPNKTIYYIDYPSFKAVMKLYKGRLIEGFGLTPTSPDKNPGYHAFCCYIPVFILEELGVKITKICLLTEEEKHKLKLMETPEGRNLILKQLHNKKKNG